LIISYPKRVERGANLVALAPILARRSALASSAFAVGVVVIVASLVAAFLFTFLKSLPAIYPILSELRVVSFPLRVKVSPS
jgi:hypothetical protein